jgi:hypothetical protein
MEFGQKKLNEFRDEAKVDEYFAENAFYKKRAGILEKERLKLKLKAIFKRKDSEEAARELLEIFYGFTSVSNPELSIDALRLGRQTISNAWYRLYNPRHTQIWSEHRPNYLDRANASPFLEQEKHHRQRSLARDATVSRVLRGGSFRDCGRYASASCRARNDPAYTGIDVGFRVARALKGKP